MMSSQGPLPYLKFCGVEVANAARVLEYLRNGLANTGQGHWELGDGDLCSILYRVNGGTCVTPDVFLSPSADPSPWYDATEPGADKFLGVLLTDIVGYDSTISRSYSERVQGLGGAVFAGMRRKPREWKFTGALISADDSGAEFGLRWLTEVLKASACDTCETCDMVVRLVCPPDNCTNDTIGEWTSYDVALVDGPREVTKWAPSTGDMDGILAGCRDLVGVEWTMVAGNPFLYKQPAQCTAPEVVGVFTDCNAVGICEWLFGDPGESHCCDVVPPRRGVLGSIFRFESTSGMGAILIEGWETCPEASAPAVEPVLRMEISGVPAGGFVEVDAARHQVWVGTPDPVTLDIVEEDGSHLIVLEEGRAVEWIEVRDCDSITCVCARTSHPCSQGNDTTVAISTQLREG